MTGVQTCALPIFLILQLIFSLALLWALVYFRKQRLPKLKEWLKVGLLGLLNPGIAYTLSLIGLTTTTASMYVRIKCVARSRSPN